MADFLKKSILTLLILAALAGLCGCEQEAESSSESAVTTTLSSASETSSAKESGTDSSVNEKTGTALIMGKLLKIVDDTEITVTVTYGEEKYEEYFEYLYDLKMSVISDGTISYASTGGFADEISILKATDSDEAAEIKTALKKRIERRINDFTGYAPEEVAKLEQSEVFSEGDYVVLAICDDADKIHKAFKEAIKE